MARLAFAFAVVFLSVFSVFPALADSGVVNVVAGKTYQVAYDSNGVKIQGMQTNPAYDELTANVQVSNPSGYLELTIPRALLDSKQGSNDIPFIVVIDGTLGNVEEKTSTPDSRIISIQLSAENKQIEIIGTYVAVSGPTGSTLPMTATPSNHTAQSPPNPSAGQTTSKQTNAVTSTPVAPQSASPSGALPSPPSQDNASQNIILRIPYLPSGILSLSYTDLGVIGAIALVIVIVIASSARRTSRIARKSA